MDLNFQYWQYISYVFALTKEVKKNLFNGLADWIIDKEPNYLSFEKCKLWIYKQNTQYIIPKNDEKEILMQLTFLLMIQKMDNILCAKYFDNILTK